MTIYEQIVGKFEAAANEEVAERMSKMTFDRFDYFGIDGPRRNILTFHLRRELIAQEGIDWDFVDNCWKNRYREMQLLAIDYLNAVADRLTYDDTKTHLKELILNKPWIDTVDKLGFLIDIVDDRRVADLMINWSRTDNRWLQRVAIMHQQKRRDKINTKLLEKCIVNCLDSKEEIVTRAIAIALKGYSNYNPKWVAAFLFHHKDRLTTSTRQFAAVHINRITRQKRREEEERKEELERQRYDEQIRKRRAQRQRRREYRRQLAQRTVQTPTPPETAQ